MSYVNGVNLLPATGEFTYDTIPYLGQRTTEPSLASINRYASGGPFAATGSTTDYTIAIDNLQAELPGCTTVSVVVSWFGSSTDVATCRIYPSTTYIGGTFQQAAGPSDVWRCSSLTQSSPGLIAIPTTASGTFIYGGTPSDQSIVRCIRDLKSRGLRVVFYPFVLMTAGGEPWRGRIAYNGIDVSSAAAAAVEGFLGGAAAADFTRDTVNLTVAYAGSPADYTYRRMILHYANLCVVAGGVDLFLLGSELRGVETIRGPAWTKAGTVSGGVVTWDYPFVNGLIQLADDVRGIFDDAGLSKDTVGLHNLIAYSADWSVWMGCQHAGENGQWPHLDQLYAHDTIDLVSFDNYLPLSDWTTGDGGLDARHWLDAAPGGAWPPDPSIFNGLGLTGQPTICSMAYLKANIEGGQYFNWFYNDSNNLGVGFDPNGSDLRVSLPEGDRLLQSRNQYRPGQELLANKQLRWWWNNFHQAIYDNGDGTGWSPHGANTAWRPNAKPITFAEYGFPACDKGTNQPNLFYSPASTESGTPFWSIWDPSESTAGDYWPRRDDRLYLIALQAVYEYWVVDGNNETAGGVPMIEPAFMSVWNWDARPFPVFPQMTGVWGDAGNWPSGNWLAGKGPFVPVPVPDNPSPSGPYATFPAIDTVGWSVSYRPIFSTAAALHASGREVRSPRYSNALWNIELNYDLLRMVSPHAELQQIAGLFAQCRGEDAVFYFTPPTLSPAAAQTIGAGDGSTTTFPFIVSIGGSTVTPAAVAVSAVYLDGAVQSAASYSVSDALFAATVTFAAPPASGAAVTTDFDWSFLCRFDDDSADFEEFMAQLYTLQSFRLCTVRS